MTQHTGSLRSEFFRQVYEIIGKFGDLACSSSVPDMDNSSHEVRNATRALEICLRTIQCGVVRHRFAVLEDALAVIGEYAGVRSMGGQSLCNLVKLGKYDFVHWDFETHVPYVPAASDRREWVKLVCPCRSLHHMSARTYLDNIHTKLQSRDAEVVHLLWFGYQGMHQQQEFPIVALGTPVMLRSKVHFPCLTSTQPSRKRVLDLIPMPGPEEFWPPQMQFLCVLPGPPQS